MKTMETFCISCEKNNAKTIQVLDELNKTD